MNNHNTIYQYKDDLPIKTIKKTREKLASLDMIATESWLQVGDNIFSVHLNIIGTTITSNGKGCTKELTLASAYGELIERISLLLPYRVSPFYHLFYDLVGSEEKYNNLFSTLNFEKWLNSDDATHFFASMKKQITNCEFADANNISDEKIKDIWIKREDSCKSYSIAAIFSEIGVSNSGEKLVFKKPMLLPYAILDYYYGSNGMCAGNTKEESITQGICEIIERYIQRKIILGMYTENFDITQDCIKKYTNVATIFKIMQDNEYEMKIVECVTEFNISVVAVIVTRKDGAYYVSFGCHPDIFVGVERAINELLQGYCLETIEEAFNDNYVMNMNMVEAQTNYLNLLKFGMGIYPASFILGSFNLKEISLVQVKKSNNELLINLVKNITKKGSL